MAHYGAYTIKIKGAQPCDIARKMCNFEEETRSLNYLSVETRSI
jgi:hypothetical protein